MSRNRVKQHTNPASVLARIEKFLTGIEQKFDASTKPLDIRGTGYGRDALEVVLHALAEPYKKVNRVDQLARKLVAARDLKEPAAILFLDSLEASVRNRYGAESPELSSFGVLPKKKPRVLSPEEQKAKVEKARRTRARNKKNRKR